MHHYIHICKYSIHKYVYTYIHIHLNIHIFRVKIYIHELWYTMHTNTYTSIPFYLYLNESMENSTDWTALAWQYWPPIMGSPQPGTRVDAVVNDGFARSYWYLVMIVNFFLNDVAWWLAMFTWWWLVMFTWWWLVMFKIILSYSWLRIVGKASWRFAVMVNNGRWWLNNRGLRDPGAGHQGPRARAEEQPLLHQVHKAHCFATAEKMLRKTVALKFPIKL